MGDKLKLGLFGRFVFRVYKKSKYIIKGQIRYEIFDNKFTIEGAEITDADSRHIEITGLDGAIYITEKSKILSYEPMDRPAEIVK